MVVQVVNHFLYFLININKGKVRENYHIILIYKQDKLQKLLEMILKNNILFQKEKDHNL